MWVPSCIRVGIADIVKKVDNSILFVGMRVIALLPTHLAWPLCVYCHANVFICAIGYGALMPII